MTRMQKIAIAAVAAVAVTGAGAAVAATQLRSPQQESRAIVRDAADQLGVTPAQLTNALKTAMKNQLDAAVKAGRLTQAEANRLKQRIDANEAPLLGPGFGHRHHGGGPGHHRGLHHAGLEAAAKYLGMTEAALREQVQDGKTLAQVARDRNKSVDGLVAALVADVKSNLDEKVESGAITRAQANQFLSGIEERITDVVNGRMPERRHFRKFGEGGPPGAVFVEPAPTY
jgi:hypothetical protein